VISKLLEGSFLKGSFRPQVRSEVAIGSSTCSVDSSHQVTHGTGLTSRGSVAIANTSIGQDLLGSLGGNDTSSLGGRDEAESDGTAFTSDFGGDGVSITEATTPVSSADGDQGQFGQHDGSADGGGNFFGALDTQTKVTVVVSDNDIGFEASALTGSGLLLDGGDLHDLIFEFLTQEVVNDLGLLDGHREEEDLFKGADLLVFNQAAEFGDRDPIFLLTSIASSTAASSTSTTTTASSAAESSVLITSSLSTSFFGRGSSASTGLTTGGASGLLCVFFFDVSFFISHAAASVVL